MLRDIDKPYYIMVDGDDTYPAEQAADLLQPLYDGTADMVVGDRLSNGSYGSENKRALHGAGNQLVCSLIKLIYGFSYRDVMTGYRAFNRPFALLLPIMSNGFQIETEISIHAVDKQWRTAEVPIEYRDRPEGSVSKLSTGRDGAKVLLTIGSLFKDYRPLALFGILAVAFLALGLLFGIPVIVDFGRTGLVPRLPTAIVAVALVGASALSLVCGLILDTVVKANRKAYAVQANEVFRNWNANRTQRL